jgi:hypothetical protein
MSDMTLTSRVILGVVMVPVYGVITPLQAQTGRDLVCRGGSSGLEFRVVADPSPSSTVDHKLVRMSLRYRVSSYGPNRTTLEPGSCGWAGSDRPPGEVLFDERPNAQALQMRQGVPIDTSVDAAANGYEDTASIRRYMSVSNHRWRFLYYEQAGVRAFSDSHGPLSPLTPDVVAARSPSVATATSKNALSTAGTVPTSAKPVQAAPSVRHLKSEDELRRVALQFVSIDRSLDKFSIKFIARSGAAATVAYSVDEPIREPSTGLWFFNHGAVQGSGAVEGGFHATVREVSVPLAGSTYTATNYLPIERGKMYHYIISVPRSPEGPEQQLTGQFTTMRQDVRVTITEIKILSSTIPSANVKWGYFIGDSDVRASGSALFENAPNRIRLWLGARPGGPMSQDFPGTLTALPGKDTGVAKEEIDLIWKQSMPVPTGWPSGDYTRTLTLHSLPGDIVFEATATIEVFRR